jgi:hypothetical protein
MEVEGMAVEGLEFGEHSETSQREMLFPDLMFQMKVIEQVGTLFFNWQA